MKGNENILIVRLGKIGDIIVASCVFDIIKKNHPDVNISLLTLKKNREVLRYNKNIDRRYFTNKNISLYTRLIWLRRYKFDLLLDLNDDPSVTSEIIRKIVHPKKSAGFRFDNINEPDIAIDRPAKDKTHIIDRMLLLLKKLNIEFDSSEIKPVLAIGEMENKQVSAQLSQIKNQDKIITLNISAGAEIREWSAGKWNELLKRIHNAYPQLFFIILSDSKDSTLRNNIGMTLPADKWIKQSFDSFHHYASYICNSDLLITADTSAVHIASSYNVPVLALYPDYEWNFISWQPLSDRFRAIRSKKNIIEEITVDEVYISFQELINELEIK